MSRVGFTGTREQIPPPQFSAMARWLERRGVGELHHGDCVGADVAAHHAALALGWRVIVHPGMGPTRLRAFVTRYDAIRPAKANLARNIDILLETDELLALPLAAETLRSGTWSTVRRARALRRKITLIWPDGRVEVEPTREPKATLVTATEGEADPG